MLSVVCWLGIISIADAYRQRQNFPAAIGCKFNIQHWGYIVTLGDHQAKDHILALLGLGLLCIEGMPGMSNGPERVHNESFGISGDFHWSPGYRALNGTGRFRCSAERDKK